MIVAVNGVLVVVVCVFVFCVVCVCVLLMIYWCLLYRNYNIFVIYINSCYILILYY